MATIPQTLARMAAGIDNPFEVSDPGTGNPIVYRAWGQVVPLTIAASASETNTLAAPSSAGQRMTLFAASVGSSGSRVITVASAIDDLGTTTITLNAVDEYVTLTSVPVGSSTFEWRVVDASGFGFRTTDRVVRTHTMLLNADCVDQGFFIADRAYQVVAAYEIHAVAGNDGSAVNMQITKDTGTDAPGAGTDLLTNNTNAGFDMKGTANTLQTGTLTGTAASLLLAAGNRLSVDFAGTVTTLAGVQVTVVLKPV